MRESNSLDPTPWREMGDRVLSGEKLQRDDALTALRCPASEVPLLVSEAGEPVNDQVLHLVAEPVEITGRVSRRGGLLTLRADPASYRRLE